MELLGRLFAAIGAIGILGALTFVTLLIGVLVHGMVILMAGRLIDGYLRWKGREVHEPGMVK